MSREDDSPPPEVDAATFEAWREPRFGLGNPQRLDNPVWRWLIRVGINAWAANRHFGRSSFGSTPTWCFQRFGQSETRLPDGRTVRVAGEHEDHYDPDFYIYNDVVVEHPDGRLEIFGYPREVFPPTDFHSATRVGEALVLIGNVGYADQRAPGVTPVRVLDLDTFAIRTPETCGAPPSWISRHAAELSEDGQRIVIRGGQVLIDDGGLVENIDDWCLHLDGWRWERLTRRSWPRWAFERADGRRHHLWDYTTAQWDAEMGQAVDLEKLARALGAAPDFEAFAALYEPPVAFEPVPRGDDDQWSVTRIRVEGVIVRYVDEMDALHMTVEGELPQATLDALTDDLARKLARVEGVDWVRRRI